jgi:hypothetical protein
MAAIAPVYSCAFATLIFIYAKVNDRVLILQLHFVEFLESPRRPGPKGHDIWLSFRGLKPPAPSGISDLQL